MDTEKALTGHGGLLFLDRHEVAFHKAPVQGLGAQAFPFILDGGILTSGK
jgi:hypothetical protein